MIRRLCVSTPQNSVTTTASLVALVLMIAGLLGVGGHSADFVSTAGVVLLAISGFYSLRLARLRKTDSTL